MKKYLILLLLISSALFSQTKYYIFLKDKGVQPLSKLSKSSALYQLAEKDLSAAAVEHRKQVMGDDYITYEDLPINQNYVERIETSGIKIENKLKWFNSVTAYLTQEQINTVKQFPFVEKIETVALGKIHTSEYELTDPFLSPSELSETNSQITSSINYGNSLTQAALSEIPAVHDLNITGENVYIGLLDNGFNWKTHKALIDRNVVYQYDYIDKDTDVSNAHYHGTAVFSLIGGYDPGQIVGPAFNAKFFLARTENDASETRAEEDNYAAALEDMENKGVQITSASLGYNEFDNGIGDYTYRDMNGSTAISTKAVNLAFQRGVFLVNSAGNEGNNAWKYIVAPSDAFNVITVGAVDANNRLASFSSRGPTYDGRTKPEVVAQGVQDFYALPNANYGYGSGTSYSGPITAGIAGLLKSVYPYLTNVQMRKTFLESCDSSSTPNNDRGYGLISASKVVSYPNLKKEGSQYKICKIFINKNGVNSSTIQLFFKTTGDNFQSASMNFDGTFKYEYTIPQSVNGSQFEFYFTYRNNQGNSVREPASSNYKFSYGDLLVNNVTKIENYNFIPTEYALFQNYPNPFNPGTIISFYLPETQRVSLKLYDILGRQVATLIDEIRSAGSYDFRFYNQKFHLASGIYLYRLVAGSFNQTKKMIILK